MQGFKKFILTTIVGSSLLAPLVGTAGSKVLPPLQVNAAARYANAALGATQNTADSVQYIECGTNKTNGYCTVRDISGTYYSCYTNDPALMDVIRSLSGDGYLSVAWDTTNQCTYILSYASSRAPAKGH